jgi:hypothetical protein
MAISIRELSSPKDDREFVELPFEIYKENNYWVPPLKADEYDLVRVGTNPYLNFCKAKFWLAYKDGKCVGRIAGIINERYNDKTGESLARFSRLEFENDPAICQALLHTAEQWSKDMGMNGVIGPLGFSNLDTQGLLIEGFDFLPSIASSYNLPYYHTNLEALGYQKEIDWVEFRLTIGQQAVEKANRGAQLVKKRYGIKTVHFTHSKELISQADTIFSILNDSFSDLPFVANFSKELVAYYTKKYIRLLNPEFVKMVTLNDEPIGFIVGLPSLSQAMQKAKGKLFPFGFYHLYKARKGKDTMDQLLTGVKKQYVSTGAGVVLMAELQNEMLKRGMQYIETTGIFETNQAAIGNWKNYEHVQHKRKRCYRKMF